MKFESESLIHEEECDFLFKLIRSYKVKKPGFKPDEILKLTPIMIKKCYNTIELIYKETLTDQYWRIEYDQMRANDPNV